MERGTELYNCFLRGDEQALERLVIEYGDAIACYAYCFVRDFQVAEDVMEDTFAALIVKRKRFEPRSPFKAYLFRIARNKCLDRLRKAKREVELSDELPFTEYPSVEEAALKAFRDEKVQKALLSLPPDYKSVLYLMYYQGMSADEIHISLGKNVKQVYNLLSRAKAALKEILIKEGIGYDDLD